MSQAIIEFFRSFITNDYMLLFILSLIPLVEMRGAVILASSMTAINPFVAMLVCATGSACVAFPLLMFLKPIFNWLKNFKIFKKLVEGLERVFNDKADGVRQTASKRYNNRLYWALAAFVAIPLPLTGVWTGSGIAVFLELKTVKAGIFIIVANYIACLMLTLLMYFAKDYVDIVLLVFGILIMMSLALLIYKTIKGAKKSKTKATEDNKLEDNSNKDIDK